MRWYEDPAYIKMCDGAEELQREKRHIKISEYGFKHLADEVFLCRRTEQGRTISFETIWIPNRMQLEEFFEGGSWMEFDRKCLELSEGLRKPGDSILPKEYSALMVIMKERYGKVWDSAE